MRWGDSWKRVVGFGLTFAMNLVSAGASAQGEDGPLGPLVDLSDTTLVVALVEDPDFPPLDERLVQKALRFAQEEFQTRFAALPPRMLVRYRFPIDRFVGIFAQVDDPRCRDLFKARYTGHGPAELAPFKGSAEKFLRRWNVGSLRGFVGTTSVSIESHSDAYAYYVDHYTETVETLKGLRTSTGSPLIEPRTTSARSFVGWLCALKRQTDFDIVLTNTFILADLMTEPHPHSVFGKAKIGGIAVQSPTRSGLGGQVLLATTFGIDTNIRQLSELNGAPATMDERAEILGAYLLAHEIAHAVFGIPDVFDHPPGCLMTSRPGASYRDGLTELRAFPRSCPKCRPYVEARGLLASARRQLSDGAAEEAARDARRAIKLLPRHFHGRRRGRLAELSMIVADAYRSQGRNKLAERYYRFAVRLDPGAVRQPTRDGQPALPAARTATVPTTD